VPAAAPVLRRGGATPDGGKTVTWEWLGQGRTQNRSVVVHREVWPLAAVGWQAPGVGAAVGLMAIPIRQKTAGRSSNVSEDAPQVGFFLYPQVAALVPSAHCREYSGSGSQSGLTSAQRGMSTN
jgi:hypothetical protein